MQVCFPRRPGESGPSSVTKNWNTRFRWHEVGACQPEWKLQTTFM